MWAAGGNALGVGARFFKKTRDFSGIGCDTTTHCGPLSDARREHGNDGTGLLKQTTLFNVKKVSILRTIPLSNEWLDIC
jgi:hypothetical protein